MLNVDTTPAMKSEIKRLGQRVRGGTATATETRAFDRLDRAITYLQTRAQRGMRLRNWWDLPIAARMWAADGRDLEA